MPHVDAPCCAICHQALDSVVLSEVEPRMPPDLDLRPGGQSGAELAAWVQHCPGCGYCHSSLQLLPDGMRNQAQVLAVLGSSEYRSVLSDERFPELANRFRAMAVLQGHSASQQVQDHAAASLLYAAWACDSVAELATQMHPAQAAAQARSLRREAAACLRSLLEAGRSLLESPGLDWLVLADIYRRAELFPSAHTATVRGLALTGPESELHTLLELEQGLIAEQVTARVNLAELFE